MSDVPASQRRTILPYFSDDISENILVRLPVKSLLRFLCVCKKWGSLISSPRFIRKHFNLSIPYNHQRLLLDTLPFHSVDLDAGNAITKFDFTGDVEFVGSCHGLICSVTLLDRNNVHIYNPATRKVRRLPRLESGITPPGDLFSGFGCDLSEDNYKVVRGTIMWPNTILFFVFNLKTDSWKCSTVEGSYDFKIAPEHKTGVWTNGHLHWLVRDRCILSFDLALEEFVEISFPVLEGTIYGLKVLGGLCLLSNCNLEACEVWVMKEYGVPSSWEKLATVVNLFVNGTHIVYKQPLRFVGNSLLVFEEFNGLLVYDTKDNTTNYVAFEKNLNSYSCALYTESLVPPIGL